MGSTAGAPPLICRGAAAELHNPFQSDSTNFTRPLRAIKVASIEIQVCVGRLSAASWYHYC
jgi:hypothetical protein